MRKLLSLAGILVAAQCSAQQPAAAVTADPDSALIVYQDVRNFWSAFDEMGSKGKSAFEELYLAPGSMGVQHFMDRNRIVSPDSLFATVQRRKKDYLKARKQTALLPSIIPQCKATYYALKYIYPAATFPPLYFVIGRFNTGGLSLKTEQIIGAEMNEPAQIPYLVAHELVHANQNIPYKYKILLEQCLIEGGADFVGELISGRVASGAPYQYAKGREAALWLDFQKDMNLGENDDFANWLYAGARKDDRPADMGYYIGYVITKAYYDKAADKRQAVYDTLNIQDCREFLRLSGYTAP